jgi:hypothetical protein
VVLQWRCICYSGATVVSQWCESGATVALQKCCRGAKVLRGALSVL